MNSKTNKKISFLVNLSFASAALLGTLSPNTNIQASEVNTIAAVQSAKIPDGLMISPAAALGSIQNRHSSHYSHESHSSHSSHCSSHY